jgi:hypothetical protein
VIVSLLFAIVMAIGSYIFPDGAWVYVLGSWWFGAAGMEVSKRYPPSPD